MRESHIERTVGEFCKRHGITYQKMTSPNTRGVSDRMLMRQGRVAFLELKAPGKTPTALQHRYLAGRRMDGFEAAWFDEVEPCVKWIKQVFSV